MKKVLALVLAVMMLATVAMAAPTFDNAIKYKANVTPGASIKVTQDGLEGTGGATVIVTSPKTDDTITYDKDHSGKDSGVFETEERAVSQYQLDDIIFRAITNENYAVTNVKSRIGRSLVQGVSINDKEERVEVKLKDDLNNTTAKDFEVSFTLKGKGKMTLKSAEEAELYNFYTGLEEGTTAAKEKGDRVTLPNVKFDISGTVGYGKVEIFLGDDTDEELEDIDRVQGVGLNDDVVKFSKGSGIGDWSRISGTRAAGSFTADALLTQHYGEALTMEARVYSGDTLFFGCDNAPDRDIVGRLADSDADMDFYLFNSDTKFTTFNSNVKLYFNDADENDFVYQIKDKKLVKVGSYSEDDGCWVVKTRTLGAYVVSDVELKEFEATGSVDGNPDTGANDVVGIATALAAVALVSAAAVSLKK